MTEPQRDPRTDDPRTEDPGGPGVVPAPDPAAAANHAPDPTPAAAEPPAAEPPAADEPPVASGAADATDPAAGRSRRLVALAAVLVVTLALAAVAGLLVTRSRDAATVASYYRPSSAPMNAARDAGRLLFSYDHRTIDQDFAAAAALTTGVFADEYERTTTTVVRPVAVENKAVVEATAVSQAVAEADPGRVVALVFINQVTTSSVVQGEKVDQSRVRMTLVERDGRWKVSRVEAL